MKIEHRRTIGLRLCGPVLGIAIVCLLAFAPQAAPQAAQQTPTQPAAKAFDSPQQAATALIAAAGKFDVGALEEIFGPEGHDIILTGEERCIRRKSICAAHHQHPRQAGWAGLEESRWHMGWAGGRKDRPNHRTRLHQPF